MIKTVVFDIGNVLVRFENVRFTRELLGDDRIAEKVIHAIWGTGYWTELDRGESAETMLPKMLRAEPEVQKEIRLVFGEIGGCLERMPYAIPWIRELKSRGYRVLYLSNYSEYVMQINPDVLDFLPFTDGGLFSCRVKLIKPDPAIFRRFFEMFRLEPAECVFLDDTEENVRSARSLGMRAIRFDDYRQGREELEKLLSGGPEGDQ